MFLPSKLKLLLPLENPLVVYPELATKLGLHEAIILQQLHYWLTKNETKETAIIEDRVWCYNTVKEWREDNFPFFSEKTISRSFEALVKKGLVIKRKLNANKQVTTNYYTIVYDELAQLFNAEIETRQIVQSQSPIGLDRLSSPTRQIVQTYNKTETKTEKEKSPVGEDLDFSEKPEKFNAEDYVQTFPLKPEILDALAGLIEIRKMKKVVTSKRSVDLLLTKLKQLSNNNPDLELEIINQSILKGQFDLYPLTQATLKSSITAELANIGQPTMSNRLANTTELNPLEYHSTQEYEQAYKAVIATQRVPIVDKFMLALMQKKWAANGV